ncbi:ECF transporter S component [Caldanaerobius polysaccharolyticus]|uniref:ECF transporter S component n=1 Tax=Caldanaerobius polysaccharolyticus TaxID=44256 RepID=UPI00068C6693|nr:ECF transporter S component [Caldanaerobius polysaccharolyticus]
MTMVAVLIALGAVGATVKIFNTVALDSLPGYFAALYLGGWYGAIVISVGHMLTAITSGFPLGLLNHLYIAAQMAVYAYLYRVAYKKAKAYGAVIMGTILNGPVASVLMVPVMGWGFFATWVLPITLGSLINTFLAVLVYEVMQKKGLTRA